MGMALMRLRFLGPKVGKLPPGINFIDIAAWHWILLVHMPRCFSCVWLFATHWTKVMLKILQARLHQYVNHELPDVQAGFWKGRGTRDQIANIRWIIEKAREFQKNPFLLYWLCQSLWLCGSQETVENSERDGNTRPPYLPPEKSVCRSRSNS